ncbi:DUF222 domain-containing protein [Parenemella sanctibonifatiensis]|uniref:DUF222 domain-containing protein n=1 Tax=Parenemella sanctibonifatiensis TaxID=2016505 RepID=A0A255EV84_9ACTN|nr:DUF222 domain-containing protein [Parenemella sanctibonifatiensis]OYN92053.1 hypothetical protein CGZ91_00575 [Parenemella sanctibonifatiensis]
MDQSDAEPDTAPAADLSTLSRRELISELTAVTRRERELVAQKMLLIGAACDAWSGVDGVDEAGMEARTLYGEKLVTFGGDGTAQVSEFLRLELGPALGLSPLAADDWIRDVQDLRHRLPKLHQLCVDLEVDLGDARMVARETRLLPLPVCLELDEEVSPKLPSLPTGRIRSLVRKEVVRRDDEAEERRRSQLAHRYVQLDGRDAGLGTLALRGQVDTRDGHAIDQTLDTLARRLADLDGVDTTAWNWGKGEYRAKALGILATPQAAASLLAQDPLPVDDAGDPVVDQDVEADQGLRPGCPDQWADGHSTAPGSSTRQLCAEHAAEVVAGVRGGDHVKLVIHAEAADLESGRGGWWEAFDTSATSGEIAEVLSTAGKVVVQPVINLNDATVATTRFPNKAMKQRLRWRWDHEAYPLSTTRSRVRSIQVDHVIPAPGGATCETNLVPLVAGAHRAKTHAGFTSTVTGPSSIQWCTPAGQRFEVTPNGTHRLDPDTGRPVDSVSRDQCALTEVLHARARARAAATGPPG